MKFTVKSTEGLKLPPGKSDHIEFDVTLAGFGLRLREGGSRSWVFQYQVGNRQRRMAIGKPPALSLDKAREIAAQLHAKVKLGGDPAGDKAHDQARSGETFEACMRLYLERRRTDGKLRASSYVEVERHLGRNLKALHATPIHKLDRRAIALELGRFSTDNGPVQANRTRASVLKFLNWCAGEGYIDSNPALFTNKNPERPRDRLLTMDELARIWRALPVGDFGDILRLLALLGQRRDEIANLAWNEVDLGRGLLALPASRMKNRRPHVVHLGPTAAAILQARERAGRSLVFGTGPTRGFSGWCPPKVRLDAKAALESSWVLHDLRRAAATHMNEIGVMPHVVEAVLGHVSGSKGGVAGVYNLAAYEPDKRTAMLRWDAHLMAAVEGRDTNVASFKRA